MPASALDADIAEPPLDTGSLVLNVGLVHGFLSAHLMQTSTA